MVKWLRLCSSTAGEQHSQKEKGGIVVHQPLYLGNTMNEEWHQLSPEAQV